MGISFSIPCDPCINKIFHWIDEKVACTHNLKKNLAALEKTIGELKARREDLLGRVKGEENRGLQRLAEIQVWLTNVEAVEKETGDLFRSIDDELHRLFLCGFCSKNLRLSYRYGKKVILTLREVERLKRDVFEVVADQSQTYVVLERQLQPIIVGQEIMLREAWKRILEDEVGIMGMYGMGGVGKTTLLTQLNNKFSKEKCGFDFVIWIVVSKELNLEKIQDEIAEKVGLVGEKWKQKEKGQKVDVIYNFLRKKRFVLFLDDLWEKVDLVEIGVPFPTTKNKCKVAFTTRSQDVCAHMKAKIAMEVQCLVENEAFDLFEKKVGERTLGSDLEIHELAKKVVGKCRGLPLALNVIGETMSCKRTVQEWRHAIDVLNEYASTFSGMEDKILPLLKYSYDNLKGKEVKSCLLYCALYPEDYKVLKERLIHYWICEEIIDGSDGIEKAENKGYEIIGSLVRASLLLECIDSNRRECVYMHDIVREMALWIASNLGKQKENFIVRTCVGLGEMPKVKSWRTVKRLSLMENKIQNLVGSPECLELTTLLLQNMNLGKISSEFFKFMPMLAVLDLSKNQSLSKLPGGISELVSLQYLSLSETGIQHLPKSLQRLKKLIHLDLRRMDLHSFSGISNLHNLKVLELCGSSVPWDHPIVEELKTLNNLEVLTLEMRKYPASLEKYLNSHKLASCTRQLRIKYLYLKPSRGISLPVSMKKLREFSIWDCRIYEIKLVYNLRNPSFLSLSMVKIMQCRSLKELTFLMFLANLKHLDVMDSDQLEDIINKEKACEGEKSGFVPFPRLISLGLINLPELKNIYWKPLPFPCLDEIIVNKCPNLKKLPFDSQSCTTGENGVIIRYSEKEWIEGVEWEDEATKTRFLSSCLQALINRGIQMKGDSDRGVGAMRLD